MELPQFAREGPSRECEVSRNCCTSKVRSGRDRRASAGFDGAREKNSLLRGEFAANSALQGKKVPKRRWISDHSDKFPVRASREFMCAEQGMRREFFAPGRDFRTRRKRPPPGPLNCDRAFSEGGLNQRVNVVAEDLGAPVACASPRPPNGGRIEKRPSRRPGLRRRDRRDTVPTAAPT